MGFWKEIVQIRQLRWPIRVGLELPISEKDTYIFTSTDWEWEQKGQSNTDSTLGALGFIILTLDFLFPILLLLIFN